MRLARLQYHQTNQLIARSFEDLRCYKRSIELSAEVIRFGQALPYSRVAQQIMASALSIPSNIAEGSQYESAKDYQRYLRYARGSASELYAQLQVLITIEDKDPRLHSWRKELLAINRMLHSLGKALPSK